MSRLYLVRHGPTHAKSMVGWSDLPADLSDTAALSRLSAHLPEDGMIVSSDLIRAVHTADAIQDTRSRLPHDPNLREMHFGDWELKRFNEIEAQSPDHIRAFWETPGDIAPPNGESWNQVCNRVDIAVDRLITNNLGRDLILVAHFGVVLTQIARAEGLSGEEAFSHKIDNLSVTTIHTAGSWFVEAINHNP
ncbi:Broad specificity phosphatase PhoE [Shimia gijangensis]|uniref:Broad specificity phosphatase PhoE n=1 Tax=Shimia gijangensis TaxID=1470563 RepID=A0A1M6FRQ8_9RHOB|nr:histidine phosphatase family protein [Shimia gijangensis]SHJ00418.1 Broad specificity phosphatase PhoE [Shimia gijangensis]